MNSNLNIYVFSVTIGKNNNWLRFSAFVRRFDVNRKYYIDYCGTELAHSIPLTDEGANMFRNMLKKDFGYPPFDIRKCRAILGKGKDYDIIVSREGNDLEASE